MKSVYFHRLFHTLEFCDTSTPVRDLKNESLDDPSVVYYECFASIYPRNKLMYGNPLSGHIGHV